MADFKFGLSSKRQIATLHADLQMICFQSIMHVDFTVLQGFRGQADQHADFIKGVSQLDWPKSKHNTEPSKAFDFTPYPEDWRDTAVALARFIFVAGVIKVIADQQGIPIRFGWDWNRNLDPRDEKFRDWGHVELDF